MAASAQPAFHYIGYDDFVRDIEALAGKVGWDGWVPDYVVGIGRGGHVPGAFMSHRTGIAMLSIDHSSKVVEFADDLLIKLAAKSARGTRILMIDDINDSGATIQQLRDMFASHGADPSHIRFAVLINNSRSQAKVDYWARTINRDLDKEWFVFPWEAMAGTQILAEAALAVPERLA
jgi:xanthine phosphoribosyltransferase